MHTTSISEKKKKKKKKRTKQNKKNRFQVITYTRVSRASTVENLHVSTYIYAVQSFKVSVSLILFVSYPTKENKLRKNWFEKIAKREEFINNTYSESLSETWFYLGLLDDPACLVDWPYFLCLCRVSGTTNSTYM